MSKLIVRYFYSPICPESFKTRERLKNLFRNYDEFIFEYFNTAEDSLESKYPWFPEEIKVINTLEGKEGKPFFFGKLFIQGEKIKGFPPSSESLKEIFDRNHINWKPDLYSFYYKSVKREKWECNQEDFFLKKYDKNIPLDICRICTKYHPNLNENEYKKEIWEKHENNKLSFLNKKLKADKLVGISAYYKQKPVGFIESFPLDLATKLGYPVSELVDDRLMITCLSIRTEVSGYGIGSSLIKRLVEEAKKKGYKSLEVIAFPDEHNWHPVSLYKKLGFKEINKINELSIMKRSL